MGDFRVKLNINIGGVLRKIDRDFVYEGRRLNKTVTWKSSEITWEKFERFAHKEGIRTSLSLIYYKSAQDTTRELEYVYDSKDEADMNELSLRGVKCGELDVYLEHLIAGDEDGYECDAESENEREENEDERPKGDEDEADNEDERPREDEEGDKSEDESPAEEEVDDGDDVVEDAGDGATDERFKLVFEEGARTTADFKAAYNREAAEKAEEAKEAEDSDKEVVVGDHIYPDTHVESDEEWEDWMSKKKRTKKRTQFHGDLDKEPYIWLFQTFNSGQEFKDQLLRYSMNTQQDVKMAKSESTRIAAVCCKEKCPWKVYCSVDVPLNKWMVKVCHYKHNHGKSSRVSMLKQGVIAGLFKEELRRNASLQAAEIKDCIKARYNIVVPLSKCYRGRRIALDSILQTQAIQFGKLWDYEAELRRSNRGITTEINTIPVNGAQMFDNFYICFAEFRNSWKKNCRPVIGLDGCFLKWELNGDLLAAVGRDADNRMYPIAWAVVRGENKDTWGWFIRKLKVDLDLETGKNLTIISDKQKGLVIATAAELPHAEHRMCARHIYANWRKSFSRSEFKNLFWGVAYSYNIGEYEEKMQMVKAYSGAAYEALLLTEPKKWCRAFFPTESHCADVHNNLSESFNRTIKIAMSKPVLSLLEDIRRQAMRRISRRRAKAEKCTTILTPITMALLEKARVENQYCSTIRSSSNLYEVVEFGNGYTVSLSTHQCACRRWDLTGIPCKHAICVYDDNGVDPERHVADYYLASNMKATYEDNIQPVNGEKLWKPTNRLPISIPEFRKPRGRPKTRDRRKEPFEDLKNPGKATRHGRIQRCSNCLQEGHYKNGCKNESVVFEGPKNKRGRPRKLPSEFQVPKRPTKPRKKRPQVTESSSQPLPQNHELGASSPIACTAPQPSASSNQLKPKAKRQRKLKVTKDPTIQRGIGVLHCPYTDRVFEVFNNRAYDTNPQRDGENQPEQ